MNEEELKEQEAKKELAEYNGKVNEASKCLERRDIEKAREILLELASRPVKFAENENERFFSFNDILEFLNSKVVIKNDKKNVWLAFQYNRVFNMLAYIYNEIGDFGNAIIFADKALYYNPMDLNSAFEKAESYKMQKRFDEMKDETLNTYDMIFTPEHLARYYRNLGYYYIEAFNYNIAFSLYLVSMLYEESKSAYNEILYIKQILRNPEFNVDIDTAINNLKENNIPFGVKKENLDAQYELYVNEDFKKNSPNAFNEIKRRLFKFTGDKQFSK